MFAGSVLSLVAVVALLRDAKAKHAKQVKTAVRQQVGEKEQQVAQPGGSSSPTKVMPVHSQAAADKTGRRDEAEAEAEDEDGPNVVEIKVPHGVAPGRMFSCQLADGRTIHIRAPKHAKAGDTISVPVQSAASTHADL